MAFNSRLVGNLYVVRWVEATLPDVAAVEDEVAAAKAAAGRIQLHGLAIVPITTPPPNDDVRKAMSRSMSKLLDHIETMHTVIEGSGFKHTILRSAMTGIVLVSGKRGRVFVHSTIDEALHSLSGLVGTTATELRRTLTPFELV